MTTPAAPTDSKQKQPLSPLARRIWRDYLSHHKTAFFSSLALAAFAGGLTAALLRFLEPSIDLLFTKHVGPVPFLGLFKVQPNLLILLVPAVIIALSIMRSLAMAGQAALVNRLGHGIVGDIQKQLFSRMIHADLSRLRNQHSGSFVSSVLYDANLVREAFTNGIVNYTQNALILVGVMVAMGFIDLTLTMIVLLGVPAVSLIMRKFGKKSARPPRAR